MKQSIAKEIIQYYPGAATRRKEYILALCQGLDITKSIAEAEVLAQYIVDIANKIIEETEQ